MTRPLPLLALAVLLAACSQEPDGPREQPAPPQAPPAQPGEGGSHPATGATRLTIYSGDYEALRGAGAVGQGGPGHALVERPLHYALKQGANSISATGIPASMDIEAAVLRAVTDGVNVRSQRYVAPLAAGGPVTGQVIGRRVTVEHTSGGAKQTDSGILLSADDGLALALADGRIKVIREYDSFSVVDGARALPQQAELRWTVTADQAGDADFLLSYPMGGLAWRAEYLARLQPAAEGCRLALEGAALVANQSGVGFADARLTLVAGSPNRAGGGSAPQFLKATAVRAAAAPAADAAMPAERRSGEYRAYTLADPIAIASGTTERVPLFPPQAAVACERDYVVDATSASWQPPRPMVDPGFNGRTGELPVTTVVAFDNTAEAGLGRALPEGRVRVLEGNDLLGESMLGHTAEGAELRLEVGRAFDLRAKREATGFRVDTRGRTITESFRVTLGNGGERDATIRVIEPLPRWSDWELVSSSVEPVRSAAREVEFLVPVSAGGEAELEYTVRYTWPEGVQP